MFNAAAGWEQASAIIKGRGVGSIPTFSGTGASRYLIVRVDRVIKGSVHTPYVVVNVPCSSISSTETALVFLTKGYAGIYSTVGDGGIIPASDKQELDKNSTAEEALISELLLAFNDPRTRYSAFGELISLAPTRATELAETLTRDPDIRIRSRANGFLAYRGSLSALKQVVAELQSEALNREWPINQNGPPQEKALKDAVWALTGSLSGIGSQMVQFHRTLNRGAEAENPFEKVAEDYARTIAPLLQNKNARTRWTAAEALRGLQQKAVTSHLKRALSDTDSHVRYTALMAICEMYRPRGTGCPSGTRFEHHEGEYIQLAKKEFKGWEPVFKK